MPESVLALTIKSAFFLQEDLQAKKPPRFGGGGVFLVALPLH